MKALRFAATGSLEELRLENAAEPEVGPGEALVVVKAAGLHPSDVKNVLGRFPDTSLPRIPGRDGAGVVLRGPKAWVGREVWFSGSELGFRRDGSHAQRIVLPVAALSAKPELLSFEQAARCGVPLTTARDALERTGVRRGTRLLVIGAAGAVGRVALQLGRARGAQVLAAARRPEQLTALAGAGFDTVSLVEGAPPLADQAQRRFGDGADVVFDTTGFCLPAAIAALSIGGRVAVIAAPDGGLVEVPVLDLYRRAGSIVGVNSLLHDSAACARMLDRFSAAIDGGELVLDPQPATCTLGDGVAAYASLAHGEANELVLRMA